MFEQKNLQGMWERLQDKKGVKMCMKGLTHVFDILHRKLYSWSERAPL
jgi:hypothetical protein